MRGPDLFADPKAAWLEKARGEARKLLERKEYITSEEVTAVCPLPRYLHRNTIGGIFHHPDFQVVGYTMARRPSSNGRLIRKWALVRQPVPHKLFSRMEFDRGN